MAAALSATMMTVSPGSTLAVASTSGNHAIVHPSSGGATLLGIHDDACKGQPPEHQVKRYPAVQGNDPLLRCGATDRYGYYHIDRKPAGFSQLTETFISACLANPDRVDAQGSARVFRCSLPMNIPYKVVVEYKLFSDNSMQGIITADEDLSYSGGNGHGEHS